MISRALNESMRLDALHELDLLNTCREDDLDQLVSLTARVFKSPIALLSLVGGERVLFKARVGLNAIDSCRKTSLCSHAISQSGNDVFLIADALNDPKYRDNPNVTGAPNVRTYAGVPVRSPSGATIGTLCVIYDTVHELTDNDLRTLQEFGKVMEGLFLKRRRLLQLQKNNDIMERQTADYAWREAMLQSMAQAAVIGAWEVDLLENRLRWSGQTRLIHGVDESYEPDVEKAISFYAPEAQDLIRELFMDCAENGTPFETDVPFIAANGERKWVRSIGNPIYDMGEIVKVVGAFQDITHEVERREELVRARERADSANKAKSNFLATMSHEIRTPLNGILGMLQMMQDSGLSGANAGYAQTAWHSAHTLSKLLTDILDYSKVEAGEIEIQEKPFLYGSPLRRAASLFSGKAAKKNLYLTVDVNDDEYLMGDEDRIGQVLINLVSNALKFTEKGGVTVSARINYLPDGRRLLRYAVCDTGAGIPDGERDKLFLRFSQLDNTSTRRHGGTGLGLAISRELVYRMGGQIGVDALPEGGSCFWVELHLDSTDAPAAVEVPGQVERPAGKSDWRVLIVDDQPVNREVAKVFCEKLGHRTEMAANGSEALEILQVGGFDMILMDIQMPGMDGIETTKAIRNLGAPFCALPIVALTANAMPGDEERYLAAGMNAYLPKPLMLDRLSQLFERLPDGIPAGKYPAGTPARMRG